MICKKGELNLNAKRIKDYFLPWGIILLLAAAGAICGAVVACFEVVFGKVLSWIDTNALAKTSWRYALLIPIGLLLVWLLKTYGGKAKQGMALLFKVEQKKEPRIPKRTGFIMIAATWLSHTAGASVGKEGVAMQIGATISHVFSRNIPFLKEYRHEFLVAGMAAGFAGIFGTPFAAVCFALEMFVSGQLKFKSLVPAFAAAFTASQVSSLLGLEKEVQTIDFASYSLAEHWWQLLLLGIVCGIAGLLCAKVLHEGHVKAEKLFADPYKRIAFLSIPLGILLFLFHGRYSSGGGNLIEAVFMGEAVYWWDPIMKLGLTALSLGAGFIGGEVMPLFSIGSTLGFVIAPLIGMPPVLGAALGYAAVFGAGTNTWIAAIVVGMEIFGYEYFPLFFIVCSMAYIFNRNKSIYPLQQKLLD